MTLADLIRPIASKDEDGGDAEEGLDEEELEILRDAGVISAPKGKRKARNARKPTHIVFVDSKDDGMLHFMCRDLCKSHQASLQHGSTLKRNANHHPVQMRT